MSHHVNFDGLSMPLETSLVTIDSTDEDDFIQGAGLTWDKIEDHDAVTIEIAIRGYEPMHFSLVEDDDGCFELILPDIRLGKPTQH